MVEHVRQDDHIAPAGQLHAVLGIAFLVDGQTMGENNRGGRILCGSAVGLVHPGGHLVAVGSFQLHVGDADLTPIAEQTRRQGGEYQREHQREQQADFGRETTLLHFLFLLCIWI